MIKKLLSCVREYKRPSILTFVFIVGEVIIECLIPFITANLVNQMKAGLQMKSLLLTGLVLILMAVVSLACGKRRQALPATCGTISSTACRIFRLKTSTNSLPPPSSRV